MAVKMTFVVQALSHWLQALQGMYFRISCKFIWLIPRECFWNVVYFIILWKKILSTSVALLWFSQVCHHLLPQKSAFTSQRGEIPNNHSSQLFIDILEYCQNNICKFRHWYNHKTVCKPYIGTPSNEIHFIIIKNIFNLGNLLHLISNIATTLNITRYYRHIRLFWKV